MKKARLMIASILITASLSGILAFNANKRTHLIYTGTTATTTCKPVFGRTTVTANLVGKVYWTLSPGNFCINYNYTTFDE